MKTKKRETPRGWFSDYPDWLSYDEDDFVTISPVYSEINVKKAKIAKRRSKNSKSKK